MTMLLTASIIVFGILTYQSTGGERSPGGRLPGHPGAGLLSRARTRRRWRTRSRRRWRNSSPRSPGSSLSTSTSTQGNTSITLQFALNKGIDAAATDVQSAIQRASGQLPNDLPSPPTFTKTNPNDQPVMYIALTSDTLSRRRALSLRHDRGAAADQHFARRFRGEHLRRERRHPDQGRSRRARRAQPDFRRIVAPRFAPALPIPARASSMATNKSITLRPNGQVETAEGYRNIIIKQGAERLAGLPARRREGDRRRGKTSASPGIFSRAVFSRPPRSSSSRSRGRPARTPSRSRARSAICFRNCSASCRARSASSRLSIARNRSWIRSTTCRSRSRSPSCW